MADLEQRYRALSRQFHPDYFYNAPAAERRASLEKSSYLNDAYRTLKNPVSRIGYLLQLEGLGAKGPDRGEGAPGLGGDASKQVPPALLEEVFALNEELDEIRGMRESGAPAESWKPRLERARLPIESKRLDHEAQLEDLSARFDSVVDGGERRAILQSLRERFLERNYINNLLASIERELDS